MFSNEPFEIAPSPDWSDDDWFSNQIKRNILPNDGPLVVQEGQATGTLIGTNLKTLRLAQGTEYFPDLDGAVLFLEDDEESKPPDFDRNLQALLHAPSARGVCGLAIGRFQKKSGMTPELLQQIIATKPELKGLPVLANLDFGHTSPLVTLPVGGHVRLEARHNESRVEVVQH